MNFRKVLLDHKYKITPYFLNRTINILTQYKQINKVVYLVFDFETDAVSFKSMRPIQLAYIICGHNGCIIEERCNFIKGCTALGSFWNNTNMNLEIINSTGVDIKTELLNLVDKMKLVYDCNGYIVGHNVQFDIRVLKQSINFLLHDLSDEEKNIICANIDKYCTRRICTMSSTRSFCNLNKNPKLCELHSILFPNDKIESKYHDALFDVRITKKCLIKYRSLYQTRNENKINYNIKNNIDMYYLLYEPLQQLNLSNTDIDDNGIKMLYYSPICDLNISNCPKITNKVFKYIKHLPILILNISNTSITLSNNIIKSYFSKHTNIIRHDTIVQHPIKSKVIEQSQNNIDELKLPPISHEQKQVIMHINTHNVVVNSVAGSGKTTTILYVANTYKQNKILILTYNKQLKFETRQKIQNLNLTNTEVHSYHSFCVKYYDNKCFNDIQMMKIMDVKKISPSYDIIILDESQDITPLYYELICKLFINSKILLLGDPKQCIYSYKDADQRYMLLADKVFNFNEDSKWITLKLSNTFRLPTTISTFINKCIIKSDLLISTKISTILPRYIVCNSFVYPINEVNYYIKEKKYNYDDIFILAPSIRKNTTKTPITILANIISKQYEYPIYASTNDEEKLDKDVIKNKIVFSSLNQVKGLERKVVIVFGFDSSYYKLFDKKSKQDYCPNVFYVGLTRSLECLSIIHDSKESKMPFIDMNLIAQHTQYLNIDNVNINNSIIETKINNIFKTNPTSLVRHIKDEILLNATSFFDTKILEAKSGSSSILGKIKQNNLYEVVSEITGTAIPAFAEYKLTNYMTIDKDIKRVTVESLLRSATNYCAKLSGYIYKTYQIKSYNWITLKQLNEYSNKILAVIDNKSIFEKKLDECIINAKIQNHNMIIKLNGIMDCVSNNIIYEFKCTTELTLVHMIQLAIYAYMNKNTKMRYILWNIFTNEKIEIIYTHENIENMIIYLVEYKLFYENNSTDDVFINNANMIRNKHK